MAVHCALLLTGLLLALLLALGAGLQFRLLNTARILHHALFFVVVAGTLLSLALVYLRGGPWVALLLPAALLLAMPLTRPGRTGHWALALAAAAAFALAAKLTW